MDTYSAIKSRINRGVLALPPITNPVFQVWVGGEVDSRVLELALLQRKVCAHYTLIAPEGSPLVDLLQPDVFKPVETALEVALSQHAQVRAYYERWHSDVEASDIVRFYELSQNAAQVYLDMDVVMLKVPARFSMPQYAFANFSTEADVFVIHGGGDTNLFAGCLSALGPTHGRYGLRTMIKNLEHRIPEDSYYHYARRLRL